LDALSHATIAGSVPARRENAVRRNAKFALGRGAKGTPASLKVCPKSSRTSSLKLPKRPG
jgi:hypothetical protein